MKYIRLYYSNTDFKDIIKYQFKQLIDHNFINKNDLKDYNINIKIACDQIINDIRSGNIKSDEKFLKQIRQLFVLMYDETLKNYGYVLDFQSEDHKNVRFYSLKIDGVDYDNLY